MITTDIRMVSYTSDTRNTKKKTKKKEDNKKIGSKKAMIQLQLQ